MKVGILGTWHVHAPDYARHALEHAELVGFFEEDDALAERFLGKMGMSIPRFSSVEALLESDIDGVIVCSASNSHTVDIIAAANAKKQIFTEKVLALTDEDCDKIEAALKENGVNLTISLFQKYLAPRRAVKAVCDSGELGKINYVRFRNCHSGSVNDWLPDHFYSAEQCGGGAMIDLGAHGMYLIHWMLGEPTGYKSAFEHFCRDEKDAVLNPDGIEDNAVTVMTFANGAIAINETGFVSRGCPTTLEIGGSDGYIMQEGSKYLLRTREGVRELEVLENLPKPLEFFLKGETPDGCGLDEATALTRMMVGAYQNA